MTEIEIYSSSGSEHEPDSVCLQQMVIGFMEEEEEEAATSTRELPHSCESMEAEPVGDHEPSARSQQQIDILKDIVSDSCEAELVLLADIAKSMEIARNQQNSASLQRSVMSNLRRMGCDAAICKSQPKHDRSFPPGKYEYMDVNMKDKNGKFTRLLVDMDFRAQFEIARPSKEYGALLQLLPTVYVGSSERLLKIVKIMCDGAKVSLKSKGMQVPPWRRYTYTHSKWLGSYKRTINPSSFGKEKQPVKATMSWSYSHTGEEKFVDWVSYKPSYREEKKLTSRLASVLMEAGLTSMSMAELVVA